MSAVVVYALSDAPRVTLRVAVAPLVRAVASYALDAMESPAPKPTDTVLNALFFSQYKNRTTVKYFILVNTAGFVVYVSDAYVGSSTDDEVLEKEWPTLVAYLPHGSVLFVDKGYTVTRFLSAATAAGVEFKVPPRKSVGMVQFEAHQVTATASIANTRIVVETVIGATTHLFPWIRAIHPAALTDLLSPATRVAFFLRNYKAPMTQGSTLGGHKRGRAVEQAGEGHPLLEPTAPTGEN